MQNRQTISSDVSTEVYLGRRSDFIVDLMFSGIFARSSNWSEKFFIGKLLPIATSSNKNLLNLSQNLSPISEQISFDLFISIILSDYMKTF
jgi:hypothetical protein